MTIEMWKAANSLETDQIQLTATLNDLHRRLKRKHHLHHPDQRSRYPHEPTRYAATPPSYHAQTRYDKNTARAQRVPPPPPPPATTAMTTCHARATTRLKAMAGCHAPRPPKP